MENENLQISIDQNIMSLQFQRADKKNAITQQMYQSMADALTRAACDETVRVVLFKGSEDCFTAGNDLGDFLKMSGDLDDSKSVVQFLKVVSNFPKPMIASVSGLAVGIGTTLLLHCDLVYAAPESSFSLPFVKLGLCAEAASSLLLPMQVGYHKAAQWLLLGESFSAEEALESGVINEIIDKNVSNIKVDDYAFEKAKQLAKSPPMALQATRALLKQSNKLLLKQVLESELKEFSQLLQGDEVKQIVAQFFSNKSNPK